MKPVDTILRKFLPRRYCLMMSNRAEKEMRKQISAAKNKSAIERHNIKYHFDQQFQEWHEWITEIDDKVMIKKAAKMDIYLDDVPIPPSDSDSGWPSHYVVGTFGSVLLHSDVRDALIRKKRERMPAYRKERREVQELYAKYAAAITGIIGSLTGLFAVLMK